MTTKRIFVIVTALLMVILVTSTQCTSNAQDMHLWHKQSETVGVDGFGAPTKICTWVCRSYGHNKHTTTTAGAALCPMPSAM